MSTHDANAMYDPADAAADLDSTLIAHYLPELCELASLIAISAEAGMWDWNAADPLLEQMEEGLLDAWIIVLRSCATPLETGGYEWAVRMRSEEHTSELQSRFDLVCRLLLEKKNTTEH